VTPAVPAARRGEVATWLRLVSGLVLMAYSAGHLLNHALALDSLEAVLQGQAVFQWIWRSVPGTLLLYAALFGHVGLVLWKLYVRRSLNMPAWELTQLLLGIAIPFWLAVHVLGSRGIHEMFDVDDGYLFQYAAVWPDGMGRQTLMLILVWVHGCIGLHFWLRIRPWYRRVFIWLALAAVLLPTLAIAGFELGGREIQAIIQNDPDWLARLQADRNWRTEAEAAWVFATEDRVLMGFTALVLLALAGRVVRAHRERSAGRVRVGYPDGRLAILSPGMTVLDGSRAAGIPHASVCGGRGRCSTCRVRILHGQDSLPPPAADEAKVLARIGAGSGVRLACQIRPARDLEVVPLLPANAGAERSQAAVDPASGIERQVAVMFADLRAFTRLAEGRLPYDVVFVLNRYFEAMGAAVEAAGGHVDKFIGDGIMALFGIKQERDEACRQALAACRQMAFALERLNREMRADLPEPLRIAIGLHVGPVIIGEMGYGRTTALTAIGDAVNVASRLETLAKDRNVQLVVSARLARFARVDLAAFEMQAIDIRGRRRPLPVHLVAAAGELPVPKPNGGPPRPAAAFFGLELFGRRQAARAAAVKNAE
jgi:adenylate cyclase